MSIEQDEIDSTLRGLHHRPLRPARQDVIGETVFSSMWEALLTPENGRDLEAYDLPICQVLTHYGSPITQREASVLASVVCWLGCNMGYYMLQRAEKERAAGHWDEDHAYLFAWTLENGRRSGTNHNIRSIEFTLTPPEDLRPARGLMDHGIARLPVLSANDIEVVDHLMLWLGTGEGQQFLHACRAECERLEAAQRLVRRAEHIRQQAA